MRGNAPQANTCGPNLVTIKIMQAGSDVCVSLSVSCMLANDMLICYFFCTSTEVIMIELCV